MSDKDAGSLAPESGSNIDSHKLELTAEDFRTIDADSNNRLSLLELTSAASDCKFTAQKQTAVEHLRDQLSTSAKASDTDHSKQKDFLSWHTIDFATNQISKDDFKRIDSNSDNVLSNGELNAAKNNTDLAAMTKHAAQVLLNEQASGGYDPRYVLHNNSVMNWHDLDPDLKDVSTSDLGNLMAPDSATAIKAGNELIKRLDFAMTESEAIDAIKSIEVIEEALRLNRDITVNAEDKFALSDAPLSEKRRLQMHTAVTSDMAVFDAQIRARMSVAQLLEIHGKHEDAQKMRDEAVGRSDFLLKRVKTEKGEVRLVDLLKAEIGQLNSDSRMTHDKSQSEAMLQAAEVLGQFVRDPIETRLHDARSNLGISFVLNSDNTYGPRVDTVASRFNVVKAEQRAAEARDLAADIFGLPQTSSPTGQNASLLGSAWKQLDPKTQLNYYRDADSNGKVDLFEKIRDLKRYNESWKASMFGEKTALE